MGLLSMADSIRSVRKPTPVKIVHRRVRTSSASQSATENDGRFAEEQYASELASRITGRWHLEYLSKVGLAERRHRSGRPEVGFPVGAAVACSPASYIATAYAGGRGSRRTHRPVP